MLNVAGGMDPLESHDSKSAFMEIPQQAGMPPGMAHSPYGPIRSSYPSHHNSQAEGVFSSANPTRPLGYPPFSMTAMNAMGPGGYSAPTHHPFMSNPYSTSPVRDGKF